MQSGRVSQTVVVLIGETLERFMSRIIITITAVAWLTIEGCAGPNAPEREAPVASEPAAIGVQGLRQSERVEAVPVIQNSAEEVVQRLGELEPSGLPGMASNGVSPREQLRLALYKRLKELGDDAVPALVRGLSDPNVLVRRNVALFLVEGQVYVAELQQMKVILVPIPVLVRALQDSDATVRAWSAQAVGWMSRGSVEAVPALIVLLANEDEGSRNSACIALKDIGTAAKDALPALRQALSDPRPDVRGFAAQAIKTIEGPVMHYPPYNDVQPSRVQ